MPTKNELSRITIDIPVKDHKRLKAMAALLGKSMREIIIESIEDSLESYSERMPNKSLLAAMQQVERGEDLVEAENAEDLFKKLGI